MIKAYILNIKESQTTLCTFLVNAILSSIMSEPFTVICIYLPRVTWLSARRINLL